MPATKRPSLLRIMWKRKRNKITDPWRRSLCETWANCQTRSKYWYNSHGTAEALPPISVLYQKWIHGHKFESNQCSIDCQKRVILKITQITAQLPSFLKLARSYNNIWCWPLKGNYKMFSMGHYTHDHMVNLYLIMEKSDKSQNIFWYLHMLYWLQESL